MSTQAPSNAPDDLPPTLGEDATAASVLSGGQMGEAGSGTGDGVEAGSLAAALPENAAMLESAGDDARERQDAVRPAADAVPAEPYLSSS